MKHEKIRGFVDWIEEDCWWGRFVTEDGDEFSAQFTEPIPSDMGQGNYFTIHITKHGHRYFYWIRKPVWTRAQLKRIRIKARERARWTFIALNEPEPEPLTLHYAYLTDQVR